MTFHDPNAKFEQTVPRDGKWTLLNNDKNAGQLFYRNVDTGKVITVPSIWYNQPVEWRIEYALFMAERAEETAKNIRLAIAVGSRYMYDSDARRNEQQAVRLREKAQEMRETGQVLL